MDFSQDITFCMNKECPRKSECHRSTETGLKKRFYSASDFWEGCKDNKYKYFIAESEYQTEE